MTDEELIATCTPNSLPDAAGLVMHGFQINVFAPDMTIRATIDLPDWETFRPVSAGHRLIEHGYMIRPDVRGQGFVNGWHKATDVGGWTAPVIPTEDEAPHPSRPRADDPLLGENHPLLRLWKTLRGAGHTEAEAAELMDGMVWMGDLSGMEVDTGQEDVSLVLSHRCRAGGDTYDDGVPLPLGNLVERALKLRIGHACPPHKRSPETAAMVAQWEGNDRTSGPPRPRTLPSIISASPALATPPLPPRTDSPLEVLADIELRDDQEEEHTVQPLTGYDLYMASRYAPLRPVDGPGCTPAFVDDQEPEAT